MWEGERDRQWCAACGRQQLKQAGPPAQRCAAHPAHLQSYRCAVMSPPLLHPSCSSASTRGLNVEKRPPAGGQRERVSSMAAPASTLPSSLQHGSSSLLLPGAPGSAPMALSNPGTGATSTPAGLQQRPRALHWSLNASAQQAKAPGRSAAGLSHARRQRPHVVRGHHSLRAGGGRKSGRGQGGSLLNRRTRRTLERSHAAMAHTALTGARRRRSAACAAARPRLAG